MRSRGYLLFKTFIQLVGTLWGPLSRSVGPAAEAEHIGRGPLEPVGGA